MEIIQNEIDMSQMNLPWVESPFFSDIIKTKNISVEDKKLASEYYENGFIVLSNVFSNELIDKIKSEMNSNFNPELSKDDDDPDLLPESHIEVGFSSEPWLWRDPR